MPDSRTIADWTAIFPMLPAPDSVEKAIANRIIADLWGYDHIKSEGKYRQVDIDTLEAALIAYAKMLQKYGVTA